MVEVIGDRANEASEEEKNNALNIHDVKHLLQNKWTLWFYRNDRTRDWKDNLAEVATFGTVEDFWALYNHVETAGKLPVGCDYSLFKEGIRPEWEDDRNRRGGRWLVQVDRAHKADTDRYWMEILMMLVGEAFDTENEHICGAVVNLRSKGDKISVWISCQVNKKEESIMKIGRTIKDRLKLANRALTYETHADAANKQGAGVKSTFHV